MDLWEEIEEKVKSDVDPPVVQTSNQVPEYLSFFHNEFLLIWFVEAKSGVCASGNHVYPERAEASSAPT